VQALEGLPGVGAEPIDALLPWGDLGAETGPGGAGGRGLPAVALARIREGDVDPEAGARGAHQQQTGLEDPHTAGPAGLARGR